jgi:predicted unusual protein kinase regulating ubiquinone biosynthesis (AarF/ABC1/UbiB family)
MRGEKAERNRRARSLRREKIQQAAEDAAGRWRKAYGVTGEPVPLDLSSSTYQTLPRPPHLGVTRSTEPALPPRRPELQFHVGRMQTAWRLLLWFYAAAHFGLGVLLDKLRHRDSEASRAVRLRLTFESMGTTFIKLGQQLSMRLDLLPYVYTRELESMLDRVPPIATETAVAIIERASGRPLEEIFAAFDPVPIGSASVACVYQAVLKSGERVAVKVRRPGIGEVLVADMRALGLLMTIGELFIMRPGFTANFLFELQTMLLEELDFVREARFNELFRRRVRKALGFASAPKIFFDHSNAEVLVAEFLDGIWLTDVLAALEHDDKAAQHRLGEMGIDPVILARRIQTIARFNNFENIFFHADLHPANVLVRPGNKIVLIDFGSCGSFSRRELNSWRRWFDAQSVNDVQGMVQAALAIIEPLPPIDKDSFGLRLEAMFWNDLYAIKSKHSEWHERISARMWIGFLKLSREFNVPMRLNTLRMIRASMLADTLAARLDHNQDPYDEYRHYERGAGRRAKQRVFKRVHRILGPGKWVRLEQGIESGVKLFYTFQRTVDSLASIGIIPLIGKAAEVFGIILKSVFYAVVLAGVWATGILIHNVVTGAPVSERVILHIIFDLVVNNGWYQVAAMLPVVLIGRRILIRLRDRDYSSPQGSSGRLL